MVCTVILFKEIKIYYAFKLGILIIMHAAVIDDRYLNTEFMLESITVIQYSSGRRMTSFQKLACNDHCPVTAALFFRDKVSYLCIRHAFYKIKNIEI